MRICYMADGQSVHTVRWCRHFHNLGHEIHLITFKKAEIDQVTVHFINAGPIDVKGKNWKVLLTFPSIKKILKQIQPDILHAHYATSYGIVGALTGFHPYVITALGSDVLISPKQSMLYKYLLKFAFKKADWITAMADHMRREIINLGVEEGKVDTVVFGIDPSIFNLEGRALNSGEFKVTSTRNLEPVYNIPHLLKAISATKDKISGIRLEIIGSGSQLELLEEMTRDLNLWDITAFRGKESQSEIASTLKNSHIFISVSLSDGNNISLNEAMACGAFPIVTDIPANRQWITDGENGFLVPVHDVEALTEKILLAHKNYQVLQDKAIPLNSQIIANQANWNINMERVESKYLQLRYG